MHNIFATGGQGTNNQSIQSNFKVLFLF